MNGCVFVLALAAVWAQDLGGPPELPASNRPVAPTTLQTPPAPSITYSDPIAQILDNRCVRCHRPGGIGPFSLMNYNEAAGRARMIKEVVLQGRMPPWHADPRYGVFSNDRRLTAAEIQAIAAWVDAGAPQGRPGAAPRSRVNLGEWRIGKPDAVITMPTTANVPASGVIPYQYYSTPTNFREDKWLRAIEVKPGNPGVVHHILIYMRAGQFNPDERMLLGLADGLLDGYAPGDEPLVFAPDVALKIPKGATLLWQMHYTPTGKPEQDRSQLGMIFADQPPRYEHKVGAALNRRFVVPAGAPNYRVQSQFVFPADAWLTSLRPHMHLRGKSFTYEAIYPNGRREVLLHVPRYDFNWQTQYVLAQPKPLPRGTRIFCTAHFDNSATNPYNPDPATPVGWGAQTFDEMMIGWFTFVWDARNSF